MKSVMDGLMKELQDCSISDIYCKNDGDTPVEYRIPIYQRNYAWGREEICALIEDVYDFWNKSKEKVSKDKETVYYIGTLVTFKRDENVFEVIDGQQRLTTIFIILMALGVNISNKLTYASRSASTQTIKAMSRSIQNKEDVDFGDECDAGIRYGYKCAKEKLSELIGDDRKRFKDYFLKYVKIIFYRVPKDVDLNHYFEVMNSRGEQLEKHEIVKARLSDKLKGDSRAMSVFCEIWDACSDMSVYIQQALSNRSDVFGEDVNDFIFEKFDDVCKKEADKKEKAGGKRSIKELLGESMDNGEKKEEIDRNDSLQPIIDFPNFLLIVLKITLMRKQGTWNVALDDKELLKEFDERKLANELKENNLTADFVKDFACNLLKARFYLDNYMVHHINGAERYEENPWKLQIYSKNKEKEKGHNYTKRNLFEDGVKHDVEAHSNQKELVCLLSMFEVTFSAKQRKNYLFYCLSFLLDKPSKKDYLKFVRKLADKYFFDVYLDGSKLNDRNQPKPNSFDDTLISDGKLNVELETEAVNRNFDEVYPIGRDTIPLYVFNYTDYRLWKKYFREFSGKREGDKDKFFESLGCAEFDIDKFRKFFFSRARKSLEHYFPQAKAKRNDGDDSKKTAGSGGSDPHCPTLEEINCFGNFAMIGSDANSSGSDWSPAVKKTRYLDSKLNQVSVASLKFMVMLHCEKEWDIDEMLAHQKKMCEIVMDPTEN